MCKAFVVTLMLSASAMGGTLPVDQVSVEEGNLEELGVMQGEPLYPQNLFGDLLSSWLNDPLLIIVPVEETAVPAVEIGEEVFRLDTGDFAPIVEEGVLTDTFVTPDLRHTNVPEPSSGTQAAVGFGFILTCTLLPFLKRQKVR